MHLTEVSRLDLHKLFEQRDKNNRFLAMFAQQDRPLTIVTTVSRTDGLDL